MRGAERDAEGALGLRHGDEMGMVGHEAAREDREATALGVLLQELAIALSIAIAEEHVRPAVSALRDVMGLAWNGDSGAPRNGRSRRG